MRNDEVLVFEIVRVYGKIGLFSGDVWYKLTVDPVDKLIKLVVLLTTYFSVSITALHFLSNGSPLFCLLIIV